MRRAIVAGGLLLGILSGHNGASQVPTERILRADREPQNWLTYSGGYAGWRHSTLDQINAGNVIWLAPAWVFQMRTRERTESTPLVVDGILFISGGTDNRVQALDARNGRVLWTYLRKTPENLRLCCGRVNRGVAALGDKIYLATLDAHVVALDAKTGRVVWDVRAADHGQGYSFTSAPLAVKDKIIVGVSGGIYPIRGFIDAYDAATGARAWRFHTVPAPNEPGGDTWSGDSWKTGGTGAWVPGSYDPELNLIFWGTGNPAPPFDGHQRTGDNLYSNSVVALDADTGRLKWHYQFTPHDMHDWDAAQIPMLVDREFRGSRRKLLLQVTKNGFFYVLDRTSGQFLLAEPFGRQTWAERIGDDGRPILLPGVEPSPEGTHVCPGPGGVTNWMSPSYSPQTGFFYVNTRERCGTYYTFPDRAEAGKSFLSGAAEPDLTGRGSLRALDAVTGRIRWEFQHHSTPWGGVLSTAGGLVFTGDDEGYAIAFDARTGKVLWSFPTGAPIASGPISFAVAGRQYIALSSWSSLFVFSLPEPVLVRTPGKPK
jgi:alcohol dehydrogenase (cytochrome c)